MSTNTEQQTAPTRSWSPEEYKNWSDTGELPEWRQPAPDRNKTSTLRRSELRSKFLDYHQRNPEVYQWLVQFSHDMKNAGYKSYGMKSIIERVRWHIDLNRPNNDHEGDKMLKINNNHAPFYARLIMDNEPDLKGFFEIREQALGVL